MANKNMAYSSLLQEKVDYDNPKEAWVKEIADKIEELAGAINKHFPEVFLDKIVLFQKQRLKRGRTQLDTVAHTKGLTSIRNDWDSYPYAYKTKGE